MIITRRFKRCMSGIFLVVLLLCLIPAAIVRAETSLSISVSGNTEVGSTITVSVSASGDGPYSGYDGSFSYDTNLLQLTGIVQGNYPKASFSSDGSSFLDYNANVPNGGVLVSATFKCLTTGSATITCSLGDIADMNGTSVTFSGASTTMTITAPIPKSSNANLSSLAISPGTLSPSFSASTQSYTASVGQDQSKITVSAAPADSKAKVSLNGVQNSLIAGKNNVKITVTAEDGTTKVYTIAVTRSSGPTPTPTPTSAPLPFMTYNGTEYTILTSGSADGIPEGFAAGAANYQDVLIPVLQKAMGDALDALQVTLVLLSADGVNKYFVYDPTTESLYPYQMISSSVMNFQILGESLTAIVPDGYEGFEFAYLDTMVYAYRLISDPNNLQILLYLMDGNGIQALYYYDTQTGMLLPYRGAVTLISVTPTPSNTVTPAITEVEPSLTVPTTAALQNAGTLTFQSLLDYQNPVVWLVYLLALFCLVLLIITIVMILRRSFPYRDEIPYDDQDIDDEQYQPTPTIRTPKFVAEQPSTFFNEFGQPETDKGIVYTDVQSPVEEAVILDFPKIPQRAKSNIPEVPSHSNHMPVRLMMALEGEKSSEETQPTAAVSLPESAEYLSEESMIKEEPPSTPQQLPEKFLPENDPDDDSSD